MIRTTFYLYMYSFCMSDFPAKPIAGCICHSQLRIAIFCKTHNTSLTMRGRWGDGKKKVFLFLQTYQIHTVGFYCCYLASLYSLQLAPITVFQRYSHVCSSALHSRNHRWIFFKCWCSMLVTPMYKELWEKRCPCPLIRLWKGVFSEFLFFEWKQHLIFYSRVKSFQGFFFK